MLTIVHQVYTTSKDLQEIVDKMKRIEGNSKCGDNLTTATWYDNSGAGLAVRTEFVVDQERARKQGLME